MNDEEYEEAERYKRQEIRIPKAKKLEYLTLNKVLKVLGKAKIFHKDRIRCMERMTPPYFRVAGRRGADIVDDIFYPGDKHPVLIWVV